MTLSVSVVSEQSVSNKLTPVPSSLYDNTLNVGLAKSYQHRQEIFFEGDPKRTVYQIESGTVCLYKTMMDGRRQIFDFASQGDLIGLGASNAHSHGAQSIGITSVKCIPRSALHQLAARDAGVALKLYHAMSFELDATRDLLLTLGQLASLERVIVFILALSQRNARSGKDPLTLRLPMTRADIGDLLGTTIETVSRSLTKLRERRLIEISQNSSIKILDLKGLRVLASRGYEH
jgi:CRP/FNR family transcriptional regulator, anaerobic regulatory protein